MDSATNGAITDAFALEDIPANTFVKTSLVMEQKLLHSGTDRYPADQIGSDPSETLITTLCPNSNVMIRVASNRIDLYNISDDNSATATNVSILNDSSGNNGAFNCKYYDAILYKNQLYVIYTTYYYRADSLSIERYDLVKGSGGYSLKNNRKKYITFNNSDTSIYGGGLCVVPDKNYIVVSACTSYGQYIAVLNTNLSTTIKMLDTSAGSPGNETERTRIIALSNNKFAICNIRYDTYCNVYSITPKTISLLYKSNIDRFTMYYKYNNDSILTYDSKYNDYVQAQCVKFTDSAVYHNTTSKITADNIKGNVVNMGSDYFVFCVYDISYNELYYVFRILTKLKNSDDNVGKILIPIQQRRYNNGTSYYQRLFPDPVSGYEEYFSRLVAHSITYGGVDITNKTITCSFSDYVIRTYANLTITPISSTLSDKSIDNDDIFYGDDFYNTIGISAEDIRKNTYGKILAIKGDRYI